MKSMAIILWHATEPCQFLLVQMLILLRFSKQAQPVSVQQRSPFLDGF